MNFKLGQNSHDTLSDKLINEQQEKVCNIDDESCSSKLNGLKLEDLVTSNKDGGPLSDGKYTAAFVRTVGGFAGPQTVIVSKDPTDRSYDLKPKFNFDADIKQRFNPNFVTPNEKVKKEIEDASKNFKTEVNKLFGKFGQIKLAIEDKGYSLNTTEKEIIDTIFKDGFTIEGHADGSPPSKVNNRIKRDHGGEAFGGITDLYERNTWLANNRAKNILTEFLNYLNNWEGNFLSGDTKSYLINKLQLKENGGLSTITVVNHLNKDGSKNPSEIGEEFRKIEFKPLTLGDITIPINYTIPGTKDKVTKEGTKTGTFTHEIQTDRGNYEVEILQMENPGLGGNLWWGVSKDDMDKIPKINEGSVNGDSIVTIFSPDSDRVTPKIFANGVYFGQLAEGNTMIKGQATHVTKPGALFIDEDNSKIETYNGKKYIELSRYRIHFERALYKN
jgi:hypothetical protein